MLLVQQLITMLRVSKHILLLIIIMKISYKYYFREMYLKYQMAMVKR